MRPPQMFIDPSAAAREQVLGLLTGGGAPPPAW
jgi:hypothetical protein